MTYWNGKAEESKLSIELPKLTVARFMAGMASSVFDSVRPHPTREFRSRPGNPRRFPGGSSPDGAYQKTPSEAQESSRNVKNVGLSLSC